MRVTVLHHLESEGEGVPAERVYAEAVEQIQVADALGYEIAWVAEHHFSEGKGRAPSPLLFLMHAAGRTSRIRLGTAVLPAPFYQPLRLAESVAMADVLMGGRLACGISSSGVPDEMRVFGVPQEGKHQRLREALLWLRRAWAGESVEAGIPEPPHPGGRAVEPSTGLDELKARVRSAQAVRDGALNSPAQARDGGVSAASTLDGPPLAIRIVPRPLQRTADMVWVAASTEGAARVAGELGHHLLLPSLRPVESSAAHAAAWKEELRRNGHDPATRHVQNTFHLVLDDDHDAAMRIATPIIHAYYERYVASGAVGRLPDESLPKIMARINFLAGGPESVAEQLATAVSALGLTHVAFQSRLIGLPHRQTLRGLELVMERVAPSLVALPAGA